VIAGRRKFLLAIACAGCIPARAQAPAVVKRIGVLAEFQPGQPVPSSPPPAVLEQMRKRGWVSGSNLFWDIRAATHPDQLPVRARELVEAKADLILAFGTPAALAVKAATTTIPIVFHLAADPIASGLVASLSRPGGNLTGIVWGLYDDKLLETLKQAVPNARRVMVADIKGAERMKGAAQSLRVELLPSHVPGAEALDGFFAKVRATRPDGVIFTNVNWMSGSTALLAAGLLAPRIPGIAPFHSFAENGGLLAYGPVDDGLERRSAVIDAILRGAHPRDIPVEMPLHFRLSINLATAKAFGITIPSSMLLQARPEDIFRT
jgi:putative ABC transport system substrate-binding protein